MRKYLSQVKRRIGSTLEAALEEPEERELQRLQRLPRHCPTTTALPGFTASIPDGPSFAAIWREVFHRRIYQFRASTPSPVIIDCGANVGLGTLFFKRQYPSSRVIAFEPDPGVFACLSEMLAAAGFADVQAFRKGVWTSTGTIRFLAEGSDAGRIAEASSDGTPLIEIETVRLKDFLHEPVDFLKLDIEGAEVDVLLDCADNLAAVRCLFVEYHSFSHAPQRLDELLSLLRGAGFRVQIAPPINYAPRPSFELDETIEMDLQLNICAYRPVKPPAA